VVHLLPKLSTCRGGSGKGIGLVQHVRREGRWRSQIANREVLCWYLQICPSFRGGSHLHWNGPWRRRLGARIRTIRNSQHQNFQPFSFLSLSPRDSQTQSDRFQWLENLGTAPSRRSHQPFVRVIMLLRPPGERKLAPHDACLSLIYWFSTHALKAHSIRRVRAATLATVH
jgi:hypothetical protein